MYLHYNPTNSNENSLVWYYGEGRMKYLNISISIVLSLVLKKSNI